MFELFGTGAVGDALLLSLLVTIAFQLSCFVVAYLLRFDKITDLAGCTNFVAIAITLFYSPRPLTPRQIVVTSLVCATRLELGAFLFYRVLKRGRDARFDEVREHCGIFLFFWVWQILWVYVVSLSFMYINLVGSAVSAPFPAPSDVAGITVFVAGFVLQVVSDAVKHRFRADATNRKKVCDVGPWRYSRHPNFCGEVLMWWGVFLMGVEVFRASTAGWATVASPVFTMFILLTFTGIPQAEGKNAARWYDGGESQAAYERYFSSTPPLWLCPPTVYRACPLFVKRLLCFELPFYAYDGSVVSDATHEVVHVHEEQQVQG